MLAHQAGLPVIDRPLGLGDLNGSRTLSRALAEQRPAWEPGTRHGYHGQSLGWYESELVSRIDPGKRRIGRFFADEVAAPLGLGFHFGLPQDTDLDRVARIQGFRPWEVMLHLRAMPVSFVRAYANPRSLSARAFGNPRVLGTVENFNRPDVQAAEIPAANGVGQVWSIAKLYGEVATGGAALGLTDATMDALRVAAPPPTNGLFDGCCASIRGSPWGTSSRSRRSGSAPRRSGPSARWAWAGRLRRPGYRYGLRVRDEPHWISALGRSS
ncbi:serine hydrolase domain-containing protein [Streptomyces scopuliridis]|uniref:serine hydrolase domain-containing protein n=1 Tax=Streptomyces scopuliridis TaxID=452529 RepID=UPI00367A8098